MSKAEDQQFLDGVMYGIVEEVFKMLASGYRYPNEVMHVWVHPTPTDYTITLQLLRHCGNSEEEIENFFAELGKYVNLMQTVDALGDETHVNSYINYPLETVMRYPDEGDLQILKAFVRSGQNIHVPEANGLKMLLSSCNLDSRDKWPIYAEMVTILLDAGYSLDDKRTLHYEVNRNWDGVSPRELAFSKGNAALLPYIGEWIPLENTGYKLRVPSAKGKLI